MFAWPAVTAEGIGIWAAALLTLAVLSAAFGENRVSRIGLGLLVGGAVGYAGAVAWQAVLWPRLLLVWHDPARQWPVLIWLVLGLLLLARGLSSGSWLSNLPLALLFGVGAALAMGGALLGTLMPQLMAALAPQAGWPAAGGALLVALGTGGVLFRFAYTGWSGEGAVGKLWARLMGAWGRVGYAFILAAMGALFAAAALTALSLLASRIDFILIDWLRLAAR